MNAQVRKLAVPGLRFAVGLVVLLESLRLAFSETAIRHFAGTGLSPWLRPTLAWPEIAAALLFLLPATSVIGGYSLLAVFAFAALLHILHGQFDVGILVVYSMAVVVSLAHTGNASADVAHDRP